MSKDNLISSLIGVILGIIAAIVFTLRTNNPIASRTRVSPGSIAESNSSGGVDGLQAAGATGGMQPQVRAAIDAARENPRDVRAQLNAAGMYYQIGQYEQALPFVKNALAIEPSNSGALIAAADTYFEKGDFTEAANFYEQVLKQQPKNINARIDLGSTFFQRVPSDYARAIAEYNRALELDSKHPDALHNLAVAQLAGNNRAEAESTIQRFAAAHPDNPALAELRAALQDAR